MIKLPYKIKTIKDESEFRLKEKGSTFISLSKPVQNEAEAETFLDSIRKKYYDATHHCYSYQLVNGVFKYSDDGEPNGTAGIRIQSAQNHFELTNLMTIVIRYYGGVKLGVGPLGKTYYEAAFNNLTQSQVEELLLYVQIEINYKFELSNLVHHIISRYDVRINQNIFDPTPKIICSAAFQIVEKFTSELSIKSNNQMSFSISDRTFYLEK